jgi:hypothetical protein
VSFGRITDVKAQALEKPSHATHFLIGKNDDGAAPGGYHSLNFGDGSSNGWVQDNWGIWYMGIQEYGFVIGKVSYNGNPVPTGSRAGSRALFITNDGTVIINRWNTAVVPANIFNCKLLVDGDIFATGVIQASDRRHKQDIKPISNLDNLFRVNSVQYKSSGDGEREKLALFKQEYKSKLPEERFNTVVAEYEQKIASKNSDTRTYFGVIAQELQEVYPDLVYEDGDGFLAVNYTGLIPVMLDAIKELKAEIDAMKGGFEKQSTQVISSAKLYQNNPNPFTESTEIRYYIPENTTNAAICIYDMVGSQIMKIDNLSKGYSSVRLDGSRLRVGMYMYSLLVDGKEIDTKRMILTDK